jgi:hypothetical protein
MPFLRHRPIWKDALSFGPLPFTALRVRVTAVLSLAQWL